jgi:hypothetical protein
MNQYIIIEHLSLLESMNAIISRNGIGELIVVLSKRSINPTVPFIITTSVFQQWKARDSRVVIADLPYERLNTLFSLNLKIQQDESLKVIQHFDEIEFSEE